MTIAVLLVVLAAVSAYEMDGEVLVLHDADFHDVLREQQYIML